MEKIYHLVHENQWEESCDSANYSPPSLIAEGFIHCSTGEQVIASANRFFAGSTSLLVILIDPEKVPAKLVFEDLHGSGIAHPHIYGKIPLSAVQVVAPLKPDLEGRFTVLPPEVL